MRVQILIEGVHDLVYLANSSNSVRLGKKVRKEAATRVFLIMIKLDISSLADIGFSSSTMLAKNCDILLISSSFQGKD